MNATYREISVQQAATGRSTAQSCRTIYTTRTNALALIRSIERARVAREMPPPILVPGSLAA